VTNAHRVTLSIKSEQTGIDRLVDTVVSSHDYGVEKEQASFWRRLVDAEGIAPERCLLLEDSLAVLGAATGFGVAHAIAIARPDTTLSPRRIDDYAAVDGVASLIG
jgi:putative hydrolase of the HAD superfamily